MDPKTLESLAFVGNVEVADPYYDCINSAQGRLTLRFEGIGGKTKVEEWQ